MKLIAKMFVHNINNKQHKENFKLLGSTPMINLEIHTGPGKGPECRRRKFKVAWEGRVVRVVIESFQQAVNIFNNIV